jgi:acyl-CoA reductase-like NAD-dependent aldehyde dehydrogenase
MIEARQFVNGKWRDGVRAAKLYDKFSGEVIGIAHETGREQVAEALTSLARGQESSSLTPYQRFTVLARASELVAERRVQFAESIRLDTGFTVADIDREVGRTVQTLLLSAEEAKRIHGEVVPMDGAPGWTGRFGFTIRRPIGVVVAITPFNSPLNTVAHKVAPALAAGNAVVLKPASTTPLTAALLVQCLLDAGLPPTLIALVLGSGADVGQWLADSPIPSFYAFTGSTEVGLRLRRAVGLRRTQLELGSLSSTIILADADLDRAATLSTSAAFRKAGQVCTSVQRLYVAREVLDDFSDRLSEHAGGCVAGDPRDPATLVGPVISEHDAVRIQSWVDAALAGGATAVAGGTRSQRVIAPTVLKDVDRSMDVFGKEVFGPVVLLRPFVNLAEAIAEVNDTPYGLAAGVFTSDIATAMSAIRGLRMGSVHINETSSSRVDLQPYGGVKASGSGMEGPKYAIEEMTEQCFVSIGTP